MDEIELERDWQKLNLVPSVITFQGQLKTTLYLRGSIHWFWQSTISIMLQKIL